MRDWRNEIRSAIAALKLEPTREAEVVEELNQHLQDRAEAMVASGLTAQEVDEALIQELRDPALITGLKARTHSEVPLPPAGSESGELLGVRASGRSSAMPFQSFAGWRSNAPGIAPHPVYFTSSDFSSGVASRPSPSMRFSVRIAAKFPHRPDVSGHDGQRQHRREVLRVLAKSQ